MEDIKVDKKITVLGKTFDTEEDRRNYFREELRKKLPELKQMEGFPIGEDEDILNLSDPPYYTACPNPWLNDFVAEWEEEKKLLLEKGLRTDDFEVDEPYAADVSEGKNAPIYNAHSYHTKVPHKAIMNYLIHYTQPGDVILDSFSGSGMAGVAAKSMGSVKELNEMGLTVNNGMILRGNNPLGHFGARKIILNDLSPAATNLSYNNTFGVDIIEFKELANKLLKEVKNEFGWMFKTFEPNTTNKFDVEYFVWSEISTCDQCGSDLRFSEIAFEDDYKTLKKDIKCPDCSVTINKRNLQPQLESVLDKETGEIVKKPKREIILICYKKGRKKYYKKPDESDQKLISDVLDLDATQIPVVSIPDMQMMRVGRMKSSQITHTHHFYFDRIKYILTAFWQKTESVNNKRIKELLRYWLDSHFVNLSYRNRYRPNVSFPYNPMTGVFYIPMMSSEANPFVAYENKLKRIISAFKDIQDKTKSILVSTSSASDIGVNENSVDYIFTDPPFGENIYYSDLNFFIESWNLVFTNATPEAIVDKVKHKDGIQYNRLIENCFREYFKVLKPGRWMTVVFSNTSASVWNGIQNALQTSGFIVANVSALDKQQGTFQAVNTTTAVKQDLVISCYKPSSEFDQKFKQHQNTDVAVWDFVEEHLNHLPIHLIKNHATAAIIERSPKILFDRLIAFYVQRRLPVPIDASVFHKELKQRFIERDGMYFTNEQVQEYDKKKAENPEFIQLSLIPTSEKETIIWLRQKLTETRLTESDIHPFWMREVESNRRKGDVYPELRAVLEENFLKDEQGKWYVPDPENEADLEKLRTKRLLRQFEVYKTEAAKPKGKIKEVRVEALRAGFKQSYQDKDFKTIVQIGDRIPNNLLMEDEVLLQFYDIASSRV